MGWPNAFSFCHLDKSLAWVRDVLEDWLGKNLNLPPFQGGKVGSFGFYGLGSSVRWRGIATHLLEDFLWFRMYGPVLGNLNLETSRNFE